MLKVQRKHILFILIIVCFISAILLLTAATPALASGIEDDLSGLIDDVEALVEAGSINHGNGNALIVKLEAAQHSLARGRDNAAANQLEAFKSQVDEFIQSGKLSPSEGQPLIDEVIYVQAVIQCDDPLGCVTLRVGEPIRLASALVIGGPNGFLGIESQHGVEIALDLQGDLFGHSLELRAEDSGCSGEGGTAVADTLVADPKVMAIVGTSCSVAAFTAAPIVSDAGYVMVSPSNTAPVLTDPQTHTAGYLRTIHNDKYQAAPMAGLLRDLGKNTSAVITTDDTYTQSLGETFVETFSAAGGTNLAFEVVPSGDPGAISDALDAIALAGQPDVLYLPVFIYEGYLIVTQARVRSEFDGTIFAAADGVASFDFIIAAGDAAEGMLISVPDLDYSANNLYTDVLMPAYIEKYGEPMAPFHPHAFDAANMILAGIEATAVVEEGTVQVGRQALRDALFATEGLEGATGTITCDEFGDCGVVQIMVLAVEGGIPVPVWP